MVHRETFPKPHTQLTAPLIHIGQGWMDYRFDSIFIYFWLLNQSTTWFTSLASGLIYINWMVIIFLQTVPLGFGWNSRMWNRKGLWLIFENRVSALMDLWLSTFHLWVRGPTPNNSHFIGPPLLSMQLTPLNLSLINLVHLYQLSVPSPKSVFCFGNFKK